MTRLTGARVLSVVCVSRGPFEEHSQFCHCSTQDINISTAQKIFFQRRCVDCGSEFKAAVKYSVAVQALQSFWIIVCFFVDDCSCGDTVQALPGRSP